MLAACGPIDTPIPTDVPSQAPAVIPLPTSSPAVTPTRNAVAQTDPNVHIWSLGGNGWALRIDERFLVFDYVERSDLAPLASGEAQDLQRGYIDADELRDFDVYVFVTHSHPDHFDPVILGWQDQIPTIAYFFGWQAGDNPQHHYMIGPRAHTQAGAVEVYTINSHHAGVPEVAYLVKVDGLTIYHNGDYLASYLEDFEYLHTITDHIDIAFVIGWPFVNHQHFQQATLLAELFHPTYMFAINREGDEDKSRQFSELLAEHGVDVTVLYAEHRGDNFVYSE
jgi:L-ascorbate metabolism protein UlaG (beta-lactamase superfamily)